MLLSELSGYEFELVEVTKETILDFSQGTVKVLQLYFALR